MFLGSHTLFTQYLCTAISYFFCFCFIFIYFEFFTCLRCTIQSQVSQQVQKDLLLLLSYFFH